MKQAQSSRSTIHRITLDAMFIAIHVLLGMLPSELSWSSLPVLLCAFLMRPGDALVVSFMGSLIEQIRYGITYITPLWILPWLLFGLAAGIGAWANRRMRPIPMILTIVLCELLLNIANTAVLFSLDFVPIDTSTLPLFLLGFLLRMPQALVRAVLSSVAVPVILPPLRRLTGTLPPRTSRK